MANQAHLGSRTFVWEVGLDKATVDEVEDLLNLKIFTLPADPEQIFNIDRNEPEVVLTGENIPLHARDEIIQIMGLKFPRVPMYHVVRDYKKFDLYQALSKGYKDLFLLPFEQGIFEEILVQRLASQETEFKKVFEKIKVVDLDPTRPIPFDLNLYLKANRKFICLLKKGSVIGTQRLQKLQSQVSFAYVAKDEMQAFYDFVKQGLASQNPPQDKSFTERRQNLRQTVIDLFREFFNSKKPNAAHVEQKIQEIRLQVRNILTQTNIHNWYHRFLELSGDRLDQAYSHACNVGLSAAYFSMSTSIGKPENLAIAGILHDLGIAFIPEEAQGKDFTDLNEIQQSAFKTHVQKTVNELLSCGIEWPHQIINAIAQHHEVFNGKGYPSKLDAKQILPEAQIIALADQLDELTSFTVNRRALSPFDAIQVIHNNEETSALVGGRSFDPKIFMMIYETFIESRNSFLKERAS